MAARSFMTAIIGFLLALGLLIYFAFDILYDSHPYKQTTEEINQAISLSNLRLPLSRQIDAHYAWPILKQRNECSRFLFPRPTSNLFITSAPNHGAGLGHQFGEWLHGPALAHMMGVTYIHTGFRGNALRWARWLGFGEGEDEEDDIMNAFDQVHVEEYLDSDFIKPGNNYSVPHFISDKRKQHQQRIAQTWPMSVSNTTNQFDLQMNGVTGPLTQATILRIWRIHVPHPAQDYSCQPDLNLLLRQKYCAARVRKPVNTDLYAEDRAAGKLIVAFHLRCGDSCYDTFRTTPFPSVIHTIRSVYELLKGAGFGEAVFHLFSQPPNGGSADVHFKPLFLEFSQTPIKLVGHFDTHAHDTLHHLVTSDLLIGAQSSFSWIASLLHHTVAMGPVSTCRWQVKKYDKNTGTFDNSSLIMNFNYSRSHAPKFDSFDDCARYRRWNEGFSPEELQSMGKPR